VDRKPEEPVQLIEVKSRKSVTQPAGAPAQDGEVSGGAGALAAINTLNAEDDNGEDAPLPEPFEYHTDSED
jgi:26S proteasome regulatory subunit N2